MEDIVIGISNYITQWVSENTTVSPDTLIKNWGFVELANRESKGKKKDNQSVSVQPIPVTINGTGDREQVSLDDDYDFIHWIRVITPARRVLNDDDAFGLSLGTRQGAQLRIVIAHKVELGEDIAYDLAAIFPENLYLTGFNFVFLNDRAVDPDHEKIYNTELGKTVYEQHRFDWNIYTIELSVEFSRCVQNIDFNPVQCATPDGECITDGDGQSITP